MLESVAAAARCAGTRWCSTDGAVLPSAATVWTAGFGVPDLAAAAGLRTDALGRLLTDETLTSVDDQRIVAAGDAAAPSGQPLRMSCQAAGPLGAQAANTVLSRIAGTAPAALNQAFVGQCISLGRSHGTVQFARTDDTPVNWSSAAGVAASIKEAICKGTLWCIRREAAKPGSYSLAQGRQAGRAPAPSARSRCDDTRTDRSEHAERFTLLRPLLFTIAYEILGSATESDDVLQDSYLRWAAGRPGRRCATPSPIWPSWSPVRRSTRCGPAPAGARTTSGRGCPSRCCSTSRTHRPMSCWPNRFRWPCWCLLETLSPDERAVFVLREVFGFDYDEIADAVGKPAPTVRQVAHRAREHVQARRKRFAPVDPERNAQITAQFLATAASGDVEALMAMLAPDAAWTADSGGKVERGPPTGGRRRARWPGRSPG